MNLLLKWHKWKVWCDAMRCDLMRSCPQSNQNNVVKTMPNTNCFSFRIFLPKNNKKTKKKLFRFFSSQLEDKILKIQLYLRYAYLQRKMMAFSFECLIKWLPQSKISIFSFYFFFRFRNFVFFFLCERIFWFIALTCLNFFSWFLLIHRE